MYTNEVRCKHASTHASTNMKVGRRYAAALLPRLFGKNPRSHHKDTGALVVLPGILPEQYRVRCALLCSVACAISFAGNGGLESIRR